MATVASEGRKPRYQELADSLRAQIVAKTIAPDAFPTESVLCARYGVSRFTVREALRQLQNEGLIQRRRGSGTVIRPAAARGGALFQPLSNVGEILQYAEHTHIVFDKLAPAPLPRDLAELGGASGRWLGFRGIRTGDDEKPIALTDAYVHPDFAHLADEIDVGQATLFRQLERLGKVSVASVTQDIQAVAAKADIAAALGVARRSPTLRIVRRYLDEAGRVIELSVSHHPGDRFAYNMHIEVDG